MLDFVTSLFRPPNNWWVAYAVLVGAIFMALQISAAVMVYFERKVSAWMQQRYGPWLVGPAGTLQPIADIVKLFFKEELQPKAADRILFSLAPIISVATCFIAFAPVPFGATTTLFGWLDEPIALQIADLNVGVLVVFAVASIGVYGIVIAGWASNSKYSLLGGLRSSAQMISYELAYGMALATVIVLAGSMSFREIVDAQAGYFSYLALPSIPLPSFIPRWNVFAMFPFGFIAFLLFFTAGVAETNRAPFDFPEAEQELVAGYHTEYSSMRFAMFFMAEYINMVTVSAVAVNLFLGGWHGPFLPPEYGWVWFLLKTAVLLFVYLWLRWTLPRVRYDQLMSLGWKVLLPVATLNLLAVAAGVIAFGL
ncbi:MAG: NADH-quinone oxidoreductase subunit NuoH [Vicinamibacterales bacterium]